MAIAVQPKVGQAYRMDEGIKGMRIVQVDFTWTANGDYVASGVSPSNTGGFDLQGIAAKFGFRRIFAVLSATVRTSAGLDRQLPFLAAVSPNVNPPIVKVRFYQAGTAFTEVVSGTQIAVGDVVEVVLLGV